LLQAFDAKRHAGPYGGSVNQNFQFGSLARISYVFPALDTTELCHQRRPNDARETGEAFRDPEDQLVEPLEGGTVTASDWAGPNHTIFISVNVHALSGK
jgi:hypothetical protein